MLGRLGHMIWLASLIFGGGILLLVGWGAADAHQLTGGTIFVGVVAILIILAGRAIRYVLAGD